MPKKPRRSQDAEPSCGSWSLGTRQGWKEQIQASPNLRDSCRDLSQTLGMLLGKAEDLRPQWSGYFWSSGLVWARTPEKLLRSEAVEVNSSAKTTI